MAKKLRTRKHRVVLNRSVGGDVIPAGAEVVIRAIEGVKVMVEPVQ